jgi:Rrf2 family nitric oxide-sensitive transcriptional repressor
MRLTKFSDYALRVLLLAAVKSEQSVTIEEAAAFYDVSRAHLKKVVLTLSRAGFLTASRGRGGGFALALPPERIGIGAVLRATEPDFELVECFGPDNRCRLSAKCGAADVLAEALSAFLAVLDRYSLRDMQTDPAIFVRFVGGSGAASRAPVMRKAGTTGPAASPDSGQADQG